MSKKVQEAEVVKKPETELERLKRAVINLEQQNKQMVEHINQWVAKVQAIDAVAYIALLQHEGKPIELTKENVTRNAATIKTALKEMEKYQTAAKKEADKLAKKAKKNGSRSHTKKG